MFLNRRDELALLTNGVNSGRFSVIYGRRRVGKTALVKHWTRGRNVAYSQAVEGSSPLQISQLVDDFKSHLPEGLVPTDLPGLLAALALIKEPVTLVIDEFPYLAATDPAVPSIFQKWIDHKQPEHVHLVLLGSSQTMMHGLFLDATSPLYGRAQVLLHLLPMEYRHYSAWLSRDGSDLDDFSRFSLVGGIPQYWQFGNAEATVLQNVEHLYFGTGARLQQEPETLLRDERIDGLAPRSILEAIGRGAAKPSEIAARLGTPQTSLGRSLAVLMNASIILRQLPFGESVRTSKRVLYHICDPSLRFWYNVYSPHRSRWHLYPAAKKHQLVLQHTAWMLEESFRLLYPDAQRYWEGDNCEFDSVRFADETGKAVIVTEIKCRKINKQERRQLDAEVREKFLKSKLQRFRLAEVEVLDANDVLSRLMAQR